LIARRQDLDGPHEFLFSGFACFIVHAGHCGRHGWTSADHAKFFFWESGKPGAVGQALVELWPVKPPSAPAFMSRKRIDPKRTESGVRTLLRPCGVSC
jgi:hypothetical protein